MAIFTFHVEHSPRMLQLSDDVQGTGNDYVQLDQIANLEFSFAKSDSHLAPHMTLLFKLHLSWLTILLTLASPSHQFTHYAPDSCTIIGDSDVYGIGIRTSYYLSFFAALIALVAGKKNVIKYCMKGLIVIMLAILVTLIRNTVMGSFAVFEWLITFPLLLTPGLCIIFCLLSHENAVICGCFGVIYSVYCFLQPWLYWNRTFQGLNPDCNPKYFIYTFIDLYNPHLIKFFKAMAIIACIGGVFVAAISISYLVQGALSSDEKLKEKDEKAGSLFNTITENSEANVRVLETAQKAFRYTIAAVFLFSGVNIIVFTEKMLARNDVDLSDASFESTSQLIPFLVGLFNLVSTLYSSFKHKE
ncbi:hypothetical protein BDV96DRAFT_639256 [Lophiotrema nucula]|uniref:Uncharacterized protein n=1 Tax=Lophiotrema nucula TaxID=690887 RepID=A0A6A5ZUM7_9PLEO|nr:hypothetical protein BDV96DRAFT_639256 [Lophiotrema nucula]